MRQKTYATTPIKISIVSRNSATGNIKKSFMRSVQVRGLSNSTNGLACASKASGASRGANSPASLSVLVLEALILGAHDTICDVALYDSEALTGHLTHIFNRSLPVATSMRLSLLLLFGIVVRIL